MFNRPHSMCMCRTDIAIPMPMMRTLHWAITHSVS